MVARDNDARRDAEGASASATSTNHSCASPAISRNPAAGRAAAGKRRCVISSPDDIFSDANGVVTERTRIGGQPVIIHYDDVPESDIAHVRGIRCTAALRTTIDLAPDVTEADFVRPLPTSSAGVSSPSPRRGPGCRSPT